MNAVALFDIDGTLVDTSGAGRRAMERAFQDVAGSSDSLAGFRFAGMTDRAIVRRGLAESGSGAADPVETTIDAVLDAYLQWLPRELENEDGYVVHPGVAPLCERLDRMETVALGLGTGNVEAGARAKLEVGSLNSWFRFGGFGCDHEDRAELLRAGAQRGVTQLGLPASAVSGEAVRVVVIGDTPKDVHAARTIGAFCVAVRTGGYSESDLSGADLIVSDLTDDRVMQAFAS